MSEYVFILSSLLNHSGVFNFRLTIISLIEPIH